MKLYSNSFSPNCRKVHATIAHVGLDVEQVSVNLMTGEQRQPEFLALNPNGKVPVLVDGDQSLWESNAIACYVAGKADSSLWPKSDGRYSIMRWLMWEAAHFSQPIGTILGEKIFKPMRGGAPDEEVIARSIDQFGKHAAVLNGTLEAHAYLTGDQPTVAEFGVAVWLGYEDVCGLPLGDYPHIKRWLGSLENLKGWTELKPPPLPG